MTGIYNIVSESMKLRHGSRTETHDLIIRRILHVKEVRADWENEDWVFHVLLDDKDRFTIYIRTPMCAFGSEWRGLVIAKYGIDSDSRAERDDELARKLVSYTNACNKRNALMEAISAFYLKKKAISEAA